MADINNDSSVKEEQEPEDPAPTTNSDEVVKDENENKDDVKMDDTKDEEDEGEGSEESEDDEELPPGLLEQPLEVSGKREKKKVDRLSATMTTTPSTEKKKVEIEEGSGVKLGDIAIIENQLNSIKAADLKSLHRLLFLRIGTQYEIKKNIRQFSGFTYSKESKEHEKRLAQLNKMHLAELKPICSVLALEKMGTKKDIIDRIIDFLMLPVDKGLKVPQSKRAKKMAKTKAKQEKEKAKGKKRKRTPKEKSKKKADDEEEEEDGDQNEDGLEDDDDDLEDSLSEQEIEESEDEAPKTKKAKVEPKKKASPKPSPKVNGKKEKSPKKKEQPKKKKAEPKEMSDLSDSDSDDEPIAKLIKPSPPTNDEIKELVKKILDGADLESVTMKTVVKEVYSKYPAFDLSDRKDFIKTTVREVIL